MKRKVVVTMSLAWWTDDQYFDPPVTSNEEAIEQLERDCDESDYMEFADEATVIKVEITETKE
jgi:hypothetical protein